MKVTGGIIIVALAALVASYAGAYVYRGEREFGPTYEYRVYQSRWEANLFLPAAKAESLVRGKQIFVTPPLGPCRPNTF